MCVLYSKQSTPVYTEYCTMSKKKKRIFYANLLTLRTRRLQPDPVMYSSVHCIPTDSDHYSSYSQPLMQRLICAYNTKRSTV